MIVIALSWLILLVYFVPTGIAAKSILKIETDDNFIPIFLGIFFQCLGLTICSIFFKIGWVLFIFNFLLITGIFFWKSSEIKNCYNGLITNLKSLTIISKFILLIILIFSLFKCAQSPFIIDNEVYYLQTIKWINEYGLVKGLGNLHPFLGQISSFHILQAGFNFNFITHRINDINGFILLISSAYFLFEFEKRYRANGEIHWIGFVLIFNILFFEFINAPSPDLSIVLFSQVLFYYFLDKESNLDHFKIATVLFLYMVFIKVTIAPIILIVVFMAIKNKQRLLFAVRLGAIVLMVFILKNYIVSGYPFYPFDVFPSKSDWTIPKELLEFVSRITKEANYFKQNRIQNPTFLDKLNSWIHLEGIYRIFNIGILFLFIGSPFIKKIKQEKNHKILYVVLLIHFVALLLTAPGFRFFLPEFVFLTSLILSTIFTYFKIKYKWVQYSLLIAIIFPLIAVNFINYKIFTKNKHLQKTEKYSWNQIIIPEKNSKYASLEFEKVQEGNLIYYSPNENFFFYGTADGNLPCVNKVQMNYLEKKYQYVPQLIKTNLEDGFYSKKISKNQLNE